MHDWLSDNRGNFAYYNCKDFSDKNSGISVQRKSAWIHGIYDRGRKYCSEND
jgi:hypothetical protein